MSMHRPLTFNEGVYLVPVKELPEGALGTLEVNDADFALTRPQGRAGSKIIDRDSAELVRRFREPRTIVEAVVLFSHAEGEDPQEVLSGAYPMLKGLVRSGYLVEVIDGVPIPTREKELDARWSEGDTLADGHVVRLLQLLEDTELYLVRDTSGNHFVVKAERWGPSGKSSPHLRAQFEREAVALAVLDGNGAPRFRGRGEADGRAFLAMDFVAGVDAEAEASRLRARDDAEGRRALLAFAHSIAEAYARLHERGFLHGDVHPRNLLVGRDGSVTLIDFGFAVPLGDRSPSRGGIPFFFEPELARAALDNAETPPASAAGEQYAVAALLYFLLTGSHTRDFSLGREEMLREIAELSPLSFASRRRAELSAIEGVLQRALGKAPAGRYPSMRYFAEAIDSVACNGAVTQADDAGRQELRACATTETPVETPPAYSARSSAATEQLVRRCLMAMDLGGEWESLQRLPAPSASINYGAAGVAMAALVLSQARNDGRSLLVAQHWMRRALADAKHDDAFYNEAIDITAATVGAASPYHSVAGVHAVHALIARATGDAREQHLATEAFIEASQTGHNGLDLTLGTSSILLGATLLLDALPTGADAARLRETGDRLMDETWRALDREPSIADASIEYLGVAHGWAGFAYAALEWTDTAGAPVPHSLERRLSELAHFARPVGRGLTWPWTLMGQGRSLVMPGWCNGSCGYVFLWTLANNVLHEPKYLDLAIGAAWDAWDAPDQATSLCCGVAGRAYALLNLYRATGDARWLRRARALAERGVKVGTTDREKAHCLWKGDLGLAVLIADLERPEEARLPFFERVGWRAR